MHEILASLAQIEDSYIYIIWHRFHTLQELWGLRGLSGAGGTITHLPTHSDGEYNHAQHPPTHPLTWRVNACTTSTLPHVEYMHAQHQRTRPHTWRVHACTAPTYPPTHMENVCMHSTHLPTHSRMENIHNTHLSTYSMKSTCMHNTHLPTHTHGEYIHAQHPSTHQLTWRVQCGLVEGLSVAGDVTVLLPSMVSCRHQSHVICRWQSYSGYPCISWGVQMYTDISLNLDIPKYLFSLLYQSVRMRVYNYCLL
jgi:hypothetical protein